MRRQAEEAQERNRPPMKPGDVGWALRQFGIKASEGFAGIRLPTFPKIGR